MALDGFLVTFVISLAFWLLLDVIESRRKAKFWHKVWQDEIRKRYLAEDEKHRMFLELLKIGKSND